MPGYKTLFNGGDRFRLLPDNTERSSSTATHDVIQCGKPITADFDIVAEAEALCKAAAADLVTV